MAELFRARTFATILDESLELTKRGPHRAAVVVVAVMSAATAIYSAFTAGLTADAAGGNLGVFSLGGMLLMIPVMLGIQLVAYCLLAILATERTFGRQLSLGEALARLFTVNMIATLFICGILLAFSLMMLILPVLITSALLSFVFPAVLIEDRSLFDAISRSGSLAWRNPKGRLRTAPLVLIMAAHTSFFSLSWGLTMAIQLPLQVFAQYVVLRETITGDLADPSALTGVMWLQVPASAVGTFASGFAAYYLFHCLALYFRDVREVREATSIEDSLRSWTAASPADANALSRAHDRGAGL